MLTQKEQDETMVMVKKYHDTMNRIHAKEMMGDLTRRQATVARMEFTDKVKDFLKEIG